MPNITKVSYGVAGLGCLPLKGADIYFGRELLLGNQLDPFEACF